MKRTDTNDLNQALMNSPSLDEFLSDNRENFDNKEASELLNKLLEKKGISKACLARGSGISEVYLHQIFSGKRNPSRNRILCICYGLSASLEDTQELLKLYGVAQLYAKNCRDAIIIYGIVHNIDLFAINDKLFVEDEENLF